MLSKSTKRLSNGQQSIRATDIASADKKHQSNARRLESLKAKKRTVSDRQSLISSSLSVGEQAESKNSKIIFDDDSYCAVADATAATNGTAASAAASAAASIAASGNVAAKKNTVKLWDDDSNSSSDEELVIKEYVPKDKGDPRFALDDRFSENKLEDSTVVEEAQEEGTGEENVLKEKRRNMKILNEVMVRKSLRPCVLNDAAVSINCSKIMRLLFNCYCVRYLLIILIIA